jgi:two-component system response regulator NreC
VRPHPQIHGEGIFATGNVTGKVSGKTDGKIRCILVHNHALVRQGLRRLLEDDAELVVVAEAGNASEALQRVFEHRPDVVLADAATIELSADDAEQLILKESPATRVLFLGVREGLDVQLSAPVQSDLGYIPPETSAEELVAMVKGGAKMPQLRLHEMPSPRDREWFPEDLTSSKKRGLTSREREVLKLLAEGQTVRSAAGVLGLSAKTVDAHKFNLMRKLGIHNKAELVMWAIQKRVVKLPVNL